jgi:hypothetical protein
MSCPNKNSKEWKDLLNEVNGNEELAMEEWTKMYGDDESLNEEPVSDQAEGEAVEDSTEDVVDEGTNNFSRVINKLRVHVQNKIDFLERTEITLKSDKLQELRNLQKLMNTLPELESINQFVTYAYEQALEAEDYMKKTLEQIKTLPAREAIKRITALQDYANNYNVLDEIDQADINEYFSKPAAGITERPEGDVTAQEMIAYAIQTRNQIKNKVRTQGIPLMADLLLEYSPDSIEEYTKDQIESYQRRIDNVKRSTKLNDQQKQKRVAELEEKIEKEQNFTLDKKNLVNILTSASTDQALIDYLMTPYISSPDSAMGLFGVAIKTEMEEARLKDVALQRKLVTAFNEYVKSAPSTRDNPAKFNAGIYEILNLPIKKKNGEYERDVNGEIIYAKRASFVQKYDVSKFKMEEDKFWKELGPKPTNFRDLGVYYNKIARWYNENKTPLSAEERQEIINDKKRELKKKLITEEEYNEWVSTVTHVNQDGSVTYMRELTQPADKYISQNWKDLYDENDNPKNAKGKYHEALTEVYLSQQDLIPESQRPGYLLPSVLKTTGERLIDNAIKTGKTELQEAFTFTANDYEYLNSSLSGQDAVKTIPIRYVEPMDASDISLNLIRSVLLFSQSANNFDALNKMHGEIKLFKSLIGSREIAMTNSKGKPILDAVAKKLGFEEYINQNGVNFSKLHTDAFVDMVVYGEFRKREELLGINIAKITDSLMSYSAHTTLALSGIKGIANNAQGNVQLAIEAASSEFLGMKDLIEGGKFYAQSLSGFISDFGKPMPESLGGRLVEEFDPMQGEYRDKYAKKISASVTNKIISRDSLFFQLHAGEHEIQVKSLFALLNREKVVDNETGEEISLLQAYKKYGVDEIYNKTNLTKKQKMQLQNRLHALNKRLHGVYNSFDQSVLQRYALLRLVVMYRKYLVPAYKRRFKKKGMDQELGSPTEGYYRTFWDTVVRDLRDYQFNIMKNWESYSAFEKAQIRRFTAEMVFIVTLTALVMVLRSIADDDDEEEVKNSVIYNHLMYQALRLQSETKQYLPGPGFKDIWRIVKSPSAVITSIDKTVKFIDQAFISAYDADARYYKKDTGVWQKGDNKTWAYFLKMMGLNGYDFNPSEAVKGFESTFR